MQKQNNTKPPKKCAVVYHYTRAGMAKIETTDNPNVGDGANEPLMHCFSDCKM